MMQLWQQPRLNTRHTSNARILRHANEPNCWHCVGCVLLLLLQALTARQPCCGPWALTRPQYQPQLGVEFVDNGRFFCYNLAAAGPHYQAAMLRAMGVDPATELFQAAGAPLMAGLLQALGPEFNAVLVGALGKGALLLGLDLGVGFLAEVRAAGFCY